MRHLFGASALIAALLAVAPLQPAHAAGPIRQGGGIYPPAPLTAHRASAPLPTGPITFTIQHKSPSPKYTWSCTIFVNGWKAGSLPVLAGQGLVSCTLPMLHLNLRLYAEVCTLYIGITNTCIGSTSYGLMGHTCLFDGTSGGWCPPSGAFTRSVNPGSVWMVHAFSEATAYDGSQGAGDDYSSPVVF
jgi:hypothetical protein